jgi:low-affinity ferrous iron transport protein
VGISDERQQLPKEPHRPQSNFLDTVTRFAGSRLVFVTTLTVLFVWAIIGIVIGPTQDWQIVIQNAGSVQCYISDTLLMRQQQNNCSRELRAIGQIRSRAISCKRMLRSISSSGQLQKLKQEYRVQNIQTTNSDGTSKVQLFDRICDAVAIFVGSIPSLVVYCSGIIIWLALGPMLEWGNLWQLYINTAVAVQLTFTSMFLQNVRRRHADRLEQTLDSISVVDSEFERRLREMTGDTEPNPIFSFTGPVTNKVEHIIDSYAHLVGSGVGVIISTTVASVWIAIGHTMQWSSNWWLIIGTYTGLVGYVDGFVLRNVYFRETNFINCYIGELYEADIEICEIVGAQPAETSSSSKASLSYIVSNAIGVICSLSQVVVGSVITVIILLSVATGMWWSETGQLICNTPTMILEGFFLLVLFQAHNMSIVRRTDQFHDVLSRRRNLNSLVAEMAQESQPEVEGRD